MNWAVVGMLVIFAAFIVLLIVNPNLSCFGKRLKSPFYPVFRRRKLGRSRPAKPIRAEDYGFKLSEGTPPQSGEAQEPPEEKPGKPVKAEDYGFHLTEERPSAESGESAKDKKKSKDPEAKRG